MKSGPLGEVSAVLATFNVKDRDGDVVLPGAIEDGAEVVISTWNHASMVGPSLPVGKGIVHTDSTKAWVDSQFFMATQAGRDTFEVVKQMGSTQPWSWGYRITSARPGTFKGEHVQFLDSVHIFEASPVVVAASIGTGTTEAKEDTLREFLRYVRGLWAPDAIPVAARELVATERLRFERLRFEQGA
jgi:hypothetical protein